MKNKLVFRLLLLLVAGGLVAVPQFAKKPSPGTPPPGQQTKNVASATPSLTRTSTAAPPSVTASPAVTATNTVLPSNTPATNTPPPQGNIVPFLGAPLCPDHTSEHVTNEFHTIWDSVRGCHYDHEHGETPFTPAVSAAFPGFDLLALLCGNEVSHCNPSSAMENVHKHGGNKWQVDASAPKGCLTGFEGGTVAIDAYAIQYHDFGRQDIEFEVRRHSSVALLRQCKSDNPSDKGYVFVGQLQEYGQRITPYQGYRLPYPDNHQPVWAVERGQYFSTECEGADIPMPPGMSDLGGTLADCRNVGDTTSNNISVWTSKITGTGSTQPGARPPGSTVFTLLFRPRDAYQRLVSSDLEYPFTWRFVCGGATYNPVGCRFNNSAVSVHEIAGTIPSSWDNVSGDSDPRVGRITAEFFVTRYGERNTACTVAGGLDCQPIKLVNAFVGRYSSELSASKVSNPDPLNTPERDIYFCGAAVCNEYLQGAPNGINPNAVPSGWIGSEN